ncbi:MAG TPA: DUF1499 domain-containing protein [bacterium]|nr:DUF1499 domain-containing protein [bacterium]
MALRRYPRINDISTDFEQPPRFVQVPPRRPEYDAARLRAPTEQAYGELRNLALPIPPAQAWQRVVSLMRQRRWRIVAQDEASLRVQAVSITPVLRFRDDVVVEVRPADSGSVVAMRSKSRLGRGDLGANAARIRAFWQDLQRNA